MNIGRFFIIVAAAVLSAKAVSIDHDKVKPFAQPDPVTVSEKAAVKFKPRLLFFKDGCVAYPAVNAAGETSGGLKATGGDEGCTLSALGSQVYGRGTWYYDVWAIMYAWYFPKSFHDVVPSRRHGWSSAVVWIDNPAVETPKVLGLSLSTSNSKYQKIAPASFANGVTPYLQFYLEPWKDGEIRAIDFPYGNFQDLITWEQLTDAARVALNDSENFGKADVPFSDANFAEWLENAWPM